MFRLDALAAENAQLRADAVAQTEKLTQSSARSQETAVADIRTQLDAVGNYPHSLFPLDLPSFTSANIRHAVGIS